TDSSGGANMTRATRLSCAIAAVLIAALALCLLPLRAADKDDGWRPLFNGKDLEGWTPIGSAQWKVEDGIIVGGQFGDPKKSGLLTTNESFTDFELTLDFMIDEHGKYNSGVYLRNDKGTAGRTGYQVNI